MDDDEPTDDLFNSKKPVTPEKRTRVSFLSFLISEHKIKAR
jgi:hypothetical protein